MFQNPQADSHEISKGNLYQLAIVLDNKEKTIGYFPALIDSKDCFQVGRRKGVGDVIIDDLYKPFIKDDENLYIHLTHVISDNRDEIVNFCEEYLDRVSNKYF